MLQQADRFPTVDCLLPIWYLEFSENTIAVKLHRARFPAQFFRDLIVAHSQCHHPQHLFFCFGQCFVVFRWPFQIIGEVPAHAPGQLHDLVGKGIRTLFPLVDGQHLHHTDPLVRQQSDIPVFFAIVRVVSSSSHMRS